MAKGIGYMEDFRDEAHRAEVFSEGPFVVCQVGDGFRLEAELVGWKCPVLPDLSIYPIKERLGLLGVTRDESLAATVCDQLNRMVREGLIVRDGNDWVAAGEVADPERHWQRDGRRRSGGFAMGLPKK